MTGSTLFLMFLGPALAVLAGGLLLAVSRELWLPTWNEWRHARRDR